MLPQFRERLLQHILETESSSWASAQLWQASTGINIPGLVGFSTLPPFKFEATYSPIFNNVHKSTTIGYKSQMNNTCASHRTERSVYITI